LKGSESSIRPQRLKSSRAQIRPNPITWQQADALDLPFERGSFDLVCCQFGVMLFPDRIAGY
jgi:ubiquinone/menaquinone biosynthesis C-methylase UbiE